ncbi:hypothetical protein [Pseudochrobactrum saccharolyticum]|uniref:Uncharacterized protein n=1 Tax=Pseudochrobactrum saccharolyticum TaxID=354352 RepID=A0A7W8AP59_9HYPH|nr:hypothetical protein [Pseudochrobactrum saccharolyticum]KAB0539871.1 hypothetical protein F7P81_00150 [Pseudochrobactrum saccharolyticum]MBB5092785.1 hypothetical protein [Pseudochrobactrum saccharolyticum]MDP8251205.1 hypothetical protein [Pseudochrobactrum saccharolyticum]
MSLAAQNPEKYIIIPFRKNNQKLVAAEMRPASSEAGAIKIATSMSGRFIGVAAYAVMVDEESGDINAPRLLASFGEVPDFSDD